MKHIKLIYTLIALLCITIGLKIYTIHKENTTYPFVIDYFEYNEKHNGARKVNYAINDRANNTIANPLFFVNKDIKLGMKKTDFDKLSASQTQISINNIPIKCEVVYLFSYDSTLSEVGVRILPADCPSANKLILEKMGDHRVDVIHSDWLSQHTWYFNDFYIFLDDSKSDSHKYYILTVAKYGSYYENKKGNICLYGGTDESDFKKYGPSESTTSSTSSSRKYKYGNSDTYQGSSQQAADLAAIDAYFGY